MTTDPAKHPAAWDRECVMCGYKWLDADSSNCPSCGSQMSARTPSVPTAHVGSPCWAAVTPDGIIIPLLCRTDPKEVESELRKIECKDWTVKRVKIVIDE